MTSEMPAFSRKSRSSPELATCPPPIAQIASVAVKANSARRNAPRRSPRLSRRLRRAMRMLPPRTATKRPRTIMLPICSP